MQTQRAETTDLFKLQQRFAARIRDPEHADLPDDVAVERMAVYEALFYNNIEGMIGSCFPVLRRILSEARWHAMIRAFMRSHVCSTPYFSELAEEFLDFIANGHSLDAADPDFMLELAHYEWIELALDISDGDADIPEHDPHGDLINGQPLISPLAWTLAYRYPVHRIGPGYRPDAPPQDPTCLLVYRDPGLQVRFVELQPMAYHLIERLRRNDSPSGHQAIESVICASAYTDRNQIYQAGVELLQSLRHMGAILGTIG